jgi:hypothetical protein
VQTSDFFHNQDFLPAIACPSHASLSKHIAGYIHASCTPCVCPVHTLLLKMVMQHIKQPCFLAKNN